MEQRRDHLISELLRKPEFKQWVNHPTDESNYFWNKWMKENPASREAVFKAREIILRIQFKRKGLTSKEKDQLLDKIIAASTNTKTPIATRKRHWLKYAAVLTLAILSSLIYFLVSNTSSKLDNIEIETIVHNNPKGQKSIVQLPDGSMVNLNSNSNLKYNTDYSRNRFVELNGEAYFQVNNNPENPFTVKSGEVFTTALGTSFNINTKKNSLEIVLVEGKVRVEKETNSDNFKILKTRQKVFYDTISGFSEVLDVKMLTDTLWTQGILVFDNIRLPEVIKTLEDWYAVEITLEGDHKNLRYSGRFQNEYLDNVLKSMSFSLGLTYNIDNKHVKLKLNGPNE